MVVSFWVWFWVDKTKTARMMMFRRTKVKSGLLKVETKYRRKSPATSTVSGIKVGNKGHDSKKKI